MRSFVNRLLLLVTLATLSGCIIPEDEINNAFQPGTVDDPPDDIQDTRLCHSLRVIQPEAELTNKLDLLFVVDTSGSLDTERRDIATGIDSFIAALPSYIDYRIAVLLAHGPNSIYSGKFYSKDIGFEVLKSDELSLTDIRNKLSRTMYYTRSDNDTDGGEVGLYSLNRAITINLDENKAKGFFRDDSALAVIFVADENDICALGSYPAGVTPVFDSDRKEPAAYNKYCTDINPDNILSQLKTIQNGDPLLLAGILYTDPETVPSGGENEIGYGYLELINKNNGLSIDLANGDYDTSMQQIGYMTVKRLNLITEFNLEYSPIDQSSIKVLVDRTRVSHIYQSEQNSVVISENDAGGEKSEIYISYCEPLVIPPNIYEVTIPELNQIGALIEWKTDIPATSQVQAINVVTNEVIMSPLYESLETIHSVEITGLQKNTLYQITVLSANQDGVLSQGTPVLMRTLR
ncbi:MAG: hypothetical protein KDD50_15410 [Bdellovibrionales bacterium]|nr:hypothetical protein [Bdellovibrionales bacterium]